MNAFPTWLLVVVCAASAAAAERVDYQRDVKPILAHKCYACHGALKQQSGLRLDTGPLIRKGGESGPAIVPGQPGQSLLLERAGAADEAMRMPPAGEGEPLDARQLDLLRRWIAEGAVAPDEPPPADPRQHWAYQPPRRPAIPQSDGGAHPVDAFLAAAQARQGLAPAPPADKATLLRRVYFDLIGLPPTPAELRAFLADGRPEAYEFIVDQLLERPEHAQRWARHWMDVWRYSDWAGYKQEVRESQRHIWRWRDWIVESLAADKGYDRMVQEMLAGDELAPGDANVLRATGYLVRNRHSSNRNIWLDATVEHTAKAFLGVTINCARCHDHKYDPIPQIAYYQMRAIFEPHDVAIDRLPGEPDLLKDGLVRAFDGKPEEPTYVYARGNEKQPDKEHPVAPGLPDVLGGQLEIHPVPLPPAATHPGHKTVFREEDLAAARRALAAASAALEKQRQATAAASESDDGPGRQLALLEARQTAARADLEALEARWEADLAKHAQPQDARNDALAREAARRERQAALCRAELTVLEREQSLAAARDANAPREKADAKSKAALAKAEKDLAAARDALSKARGELDKPDAAYTPVAKAYPQTSTGRRLALARWITRPDNPLAARVAVNHVWLRHFGTPLVENVFDFGLRSPRPLHAELLDWLAVELVEHGWSMKHLHQLLVTSRAYRRASGGAELPEASVRLDPDNRYYWRMNSRRLEAEIVRDALLYVGGSLDLTLGGPDLDQNLGETSRRRSLYFRHAYEKQMQFLVLFDAANVNECYRRSESVIPQQALAVANSTLSLTQARLLARRLAEETPAGGGTDPDFVRLAFEQILARPPTADELAVCRQFLAAQAERLANPSRLTPHAGGSKAPIPPASDPQARARENLVHVLLNHNDFVTIR